MARLGGSLEDKKGAQAAAKSADLHCEALVSPHSPKYLIISFLLCYILWFSIHADEVDYDGMAALPWRFSDAVFDAVAKGYTDRFVCPLKRAKR